MAPFVNGILDYAQGPWDLGFRALHETWRLELLIWVKAKQTKETIMEVEICNKYRPIHVLLPLRNIGDYLVIRLHRHQDLASNLAHYSVHGQGNSMKMTVTTRSGDYRVFQVKNTWTKSFLCLSCTSDNEVPTASAKIHLRFAGLGEKRVVFQKDGKASHVYKKLVSEFPPLAEGGGFKILRTRENSSKMLCVLPVHLVAGTQYPI